MSKKYIEKRLLQNRRTTIPASFKIPETYEFYTKATPFVQRTQLFAADEVTNGNQQYPNETRVSTESIARSLDERPSTSTTQNEENAAVKETEKSPKRGSFFFSTTKSCRIHGRAFFRIQNSSKKTDSLRQKVQELKTGLDISAPIGHSEDCENQNEIPADGADVAGTSTQIDGAELGAGQNGLISYAPGWSLKGEHLLKWQASGKTTLEIYTDWANHYLERARSRRRASSATLARDCADGQLLADLLDGVLAGRVHRPHRKPRGRQQMLENVQACLDFLHAQKVLGLEQVTAVDVRDAKLKAVLALFFALSRHKQAVKQVRAAPSGGGSQDPCFGQRLTGAASYEDSLLAVTPNHVNMTTVAANRQGGLPNGGLTSIPLPASAAAARRCPPDKRPLPATPNHHHGLKSGSALSASSSRSTSPSAQNNVVSFIPRAPSGTGSRPNSSLLAPGSKIPGSPFNQQQQQQPNSQNVQQTKQSMLDKLKLFNKEKSTSDKQKNNPVVSKRTSSSSGFSSAKSERSDSSLSLNESSNATNAHLRISSIAGPRNLRGQQEVQCRDINKSNKNVKSKLVISKPVKESSMLNKCNNVKTSNSDKSSRNSPKLQPKDKESKIAAPKLVANAKPVDQRPCTKSQETKIMRLSGSQSKLVSEPRNEVPKSNCDQRNQQPRKEYQQPCNQGIPNSNSNNMFPAPGNPNLTGIPKPTAAVKGTFKMPKEERHNVSKTGVSQLSPIQSNSSLASLSNLNTSPFGRDQSSMSKDSISQKQTLAVSPMPVNNSFGGNQSQMSESSHSNSTHSASTGQHSNSSDSSVIYRPSSESGSDISKALTHPIIPNRKGPVGGFTTDVIAQAESLEKQTARKRMMENEQRLKMNQQLEMSRLRSDRSNSPSHGRDNSLGDDENPMMNVMPMRPLLRGYNSHLTLPTRTSGLTQKMANTGFPHHANTVKANFGRDCVGGYGRNNYVVGFSNPDYCDADVASGYMSDGDCLRRLNVSDVERTRTNDVMDGYMSEGGASLYGRRIHHFQPPMQAFDEREGCRAGRGMEGGRARSRTDSAQQTEANGHARNGDTHWKKYTDSPGVGTPVQQVSAPLSPSHSRKSRTGHHSPQHRREKIAATSPHHQQQYASPPPGNQHSNRSGSSQVQPTSSSRPASAASSNGKGKAPQSFGYVKRQNGSQTASPTQPHHQGGRTAQVSAVPRTKVKVSGGTQTCTQDLQIHKNGMGAKAYSLGGAAAAQLSASVRERLLGSQSLPKPGTHEFAALFHHHRVAPRGGIKISDGSLSDTQTYAEVKSDYGIPYAPWLRHSNTYSASGGRLSEGESMESLAAGQVPHKPGQQRASLKLLQRDARLNRSNSIRSTKSEKLYPSMLQRSSESDYEPYYCLPVQYGPQGQGLNYGVSEPPSPSPRSALSPTHQPGVLHTPRHSHHFSKKNDEAHGSSASLVSSASSLLAEERQAVEVRKLRRELADAKDKVHTLTTQLTTNAHVVSAFEQSLSNMTQRLQQLTATAERKDSELTELRQTIELLRKQSIQAGLTTAHMQSMGIRTDGVNISGQDPAGAAPATPGSASSSPQRRPAPGAITRHLSTDSVSSLNSLSSGSSAAQDKKHKKKGWLRSSFTKAFSRNAKISKTSKHASLGQLGEPPHLYDDPHTIREGSHENSLEHSHELLSDGGEKAGEKVGEKGAGGVKAGGEGDAEGSEKPSEEPGLVDELKRQLREKDLVLTDIRLEALSSAHQLESLKDTVIKMRNEMLNLKHNNERLQRLVTSRSLAGSQSSLGTGGSGGPGSEDPRRFSLADQSSHQAMEMHSHSLDLDFNCMSSTPTLEGFSKSKASPKSGQEPVYGNKTMCELSDNGETMITAMGAHDGGDMFEGNGLSSSERGSGEYDINTVLPPPKSRELAIGESYSDIGVAESQGDTTDGKKIAIAVYLGQPETFQRYFEELQDTMTESECRFYNKHFDKQSSFDSPRISQNHSPETENQDFTNAINKSNTNSLKSNKSAHSDSFKNLYGTDSALNCNEFTIAYTYISGKTTWQNLDYIVRKTFKDYLSRIDPGTNLGLNTDSITSYHLGEATRGPEISFPELLPCGYIIGTVNTLYICLQGVGSLAFDSLIPKNIVYRYISLLSEHRRVILCGPSGTGKSYLATKLAEFYVQRTQRRGNAAEAIATFNVDHKSCKELRAYLTNISEQCELPDALPAVLILDNLQHASALGDAFSGLLAHNNRRMPVIIGTMSQATCNTTNLQLHHNFRWLLTANHMEPVKGFLARYLRRKLFTLELRRGRRDPALAAVLEWLPGVWQHLNAFLEAHSSSDVTVGPRLFLACPMDLDSSQAWFADVWNYSIVPYVVEAAREGVALYGRRRNASNGSTDPLAHVKATYPWREPNHSHTLRGISLEDIGLDDANQDADNTNTQDPLLNMLMRLQEAANYSGNQSQDSDNASLDSNLTHDSSVGNEI